MVDDPSWVLSAYTQLIRPPTQQEFSRLKRLTSMYQHKIAILKDWRGAPGGDSFLRAEVSALAWVLRELDPTKLGR